MRVCGTLYMVVSLPPDHYHQTSVWAANTYPCDVRALRTSGSWEFAGAINKAANPLRAITPGSGAYLNEVRTPMSSSRLRML
jgi:hypothetical protein